MLLAGSGRRQLGGALRVQAGLPTGTVYPLLDKLRRAGVLVAEWEQIDPTQEGRPRRRYWRFTPDGAALAEADRVERLAALRKIRTGSSRVAGEQP
jgi:PadR family transcriptional regulator, regulatory protein PadR